jgi:hypothetical protein
MTSCVGNKAALIISSMATSVNLPSEKPAAIECTTPCTPANLTIELITTASPRTKINTFPVVRRVPVRVWLSIEVLLRVPEVQPAEVLNE